MFCVCLLVVLVYTAAGEGLTDKAGDICDIPGICADNERCLVVTGDVQCIPMSFCEADSCGEGFICTEDFLSMTFNCSCEAGSALVGDQCVPFCELDACLEGMVCVPYDASFDCVCSERFVMSDEGECIPLCQTDPCPDNMECLLQENNTFSCLCKDGYLLTQQDENGEVRDRCETYCNAASCPEDMTCVEHQDSFSCLCPEGTSMSSEEVCVADCLNTGCEEGLECRQRGAKYGCYCSIGHILHDNVCTPMCATKPCPDHMDCLLHNDTFSCICKDGELMDSDTGDCARICGLDLCPSTMDCLVHNETYSCVCRDGEILNDDGVCVPYCQTSPCPTHLLCQPHPTSFSCICPDNGVLVKEQCTGMCGIRQCNGTCSAGRSQGLVWYQCECPECNCSADPCQDHEVCTDSSTGYQCSCQAGYDLVEGQCHDVDECQSDVCKGGMECSNLPGSYSCKCPKGTVWNTEQCEDINECLVNPCPEAMQCENLVRGFACTCAPGYQMLDQECVDIDECVVLKDACLEGMACQNLPGSFRCSCPTGYYADDSGRCRDVDECVLRDVCNKGDICINTPGSFRCDCADASCEEDLSCQHCDHSTEYCREGVCRCKYGYILKRGRCVSKCGYGLCGGANTLCDVQSTEACSCQPGYTTYTSAYVAPCIDVNECEGMPCGKNERCVNRRGGYRCLCKTGYFLNNTECSDIADTPYVDIEMVSKNIFSIGETASIITKIRTAHDKSPAWTNVAWSKGLVALSPPPPRYTTPYNRQVLIIKNFVPEDAGNYTLRVRKKGYLTTTAVIPVYVKPLITKLSKARQYGQWTKLDVQVAFKGLWEVEWYRVTGYKKQLLLPSQDVKFARKHQTIRIRNNQGMLYEARVVGMLGNRMFTGTEQFDL